MSAPQIKVQPIKNPALPTKKSPEYKFWRGFKTPLLTKENNAVTHIHFSPTSPHNYAVTSSSRVQIFCAKSRQQIRVFNQFGATTTVYSGEFRADGQVLVVGESTGSVKAFSAAGKSALFTTPVLNYATHVTKFSPSSNTTLLSASDDRIVRLWDLSQPNTPVSTFDDHNDYVRAANFIPSTNLVVSGCYDGTVRVFDPRAPKSEGPVTSYDQGDSVESVMALNSTTLLSAGGPVVKVWDIAAGKMVRELTNFQRTVTCLASAGERGILAGSLDGHVKVFDSSSPTWDVKFGWKFGGSVLSTAVSPDYKHVVTGLLSGLFTVRTRKTEPRVVQGQKKDKSGNFSRMIRGAEYHGDTEHRVLNDKPKPLKKLKTYEKHLNAFRWGDAFDAAFANGMTPEMTVTVLEELKRRGKVAVSLSGRDEDSLEPLLKWANRAILDTRTVSTVADWVGCVVDMYGSLIDKSPILESFMLDLYRKLQHEIGKAKESQKIEGMLEMLLTR
ncbi:U3 small nucleolar RNA-associated protein 15 [Trichomonascus vanleenenianus]|uniref:snoRNA-binding rRNA-processing protein UTP15 n=1 Tax=Trichomonascus vanleenenianus TaxID=2268995 RepID=UPI003EC95434